MGWDEGFIGGWEMIKSKFIEEKTDKIKAYINISLYVYVFTVIPECSL